MIRGAVQGVGFRPFIYRLAVEIGLAGWVKNTSQGVFIEVEGDRDALENFLLRLEAEKPPQAFIQSLESTYLDTTGYHGFEIHSSEKSGEITAIVLPDIATCAECLREIFDPADKRYLYPFTNCTNCGPRFSIIEALPYDRRHTTMKNFNMCPRCREEYDNPLNRRFHAQPNACPDCGPHIELWDNEGNCLAARHDALLKAVESVERGEIVAIKGLGGFHLIVDARNDEAVMRLRKRKKREEKPFAIMFPSLEMIKVHCGVSPLEERLLLSPECPIVLLRRKSSDEFGIKPVASAVAPGNPYLGIILPYTPLHHILMRKLGFPIVATSGNLKDEPICTEENEALERLGGIADLFLMHNRPIARHIDDSIVRIVSGRELVLRRARGYAPLPVSRRESKEAVLAVGGHLKNTVALAVGGDIFLSQHIGDLETTQAYEAFHQVIDSFKALYNCQPEKIVCDKHPDYLSTRFAMKSGLPVIEIQHHYAHILSCMAENELEGSLLGVCWDGTGYGGDGTIWGGEFLRADRSRFERVAHFRTFPLPGGDKAVKEPRRSALGLLYETFGEELFDFSELEPLETFSTQDKNNLRKILSRRLNSPLTSSVGRLFDAVASIIGVRQINDFEGQAAMELEFLTNNDISGVYPFKINDETPSLVIDWEPVIRWVIQDLQNGFSRNEISTRFHNTLVEIIIEIARRAAEVRVVLTGGCFQNKYLSELAVIRLKEEGFKPYWHQRVPPNDGGIALGQVVAASIAQ